MVPTIGQGLGSGTCQGWLEAVSVDIICRPSVLSVVSCDQIVCLVFGNIAHDHVQDTDRLYHDISHLSDNGHIQPGNAGFHPNSLTLVCIYKY